MRQSVLYLTAALICIAFASLIPTIAAPVDDPSLVNLIYQYEDVRIDAKDLAFFLATHGYDATPEDGYVKLNLDGTAYDLVPNGECPGLANVTISDLI